MTNYNFTNELAGAVMPDNSSIVTPSGFKLFTDSGDRETMVFEAPGGAKVKFSAPVEFEDPEEPQNGAKWNVYLPEAIEFAKIDTMVDTEKFLKDLIIEFARRMDLVTSDWKPTEVHFLGAD